MEVISVWLKFGNDNSNDGNGSKVIMEVISICLGVKVSKLCIYFIVNENVLKTTFKALNKIIVHLI